MKENKILRLGEGVLVVLLLIILTVIALINIRRGYVHHPRMLIIVAIGLAFFVIARASVRRQGNVFWSGTRHMSPSMANLYRAGCWLMFVGCLLTFV